MYTQSCDAFLLKEASYFQSVEVGLPVFHALQTPPEIDNRSNGDRAPVN